MDWATDSTRTVAGRWAAILVGLVACGADLGCARMNSILRDEPPMLGAPLSPTSTIRKSANAPAVGRGPTASRPATGRPSSRGDLLSQSFGRTEPRPAPSGATDQRETVAESTPIDPGPVAETETETEAEAEESSVRKTGLATPSDSSDSPGISLRPPVSLGHPSTLRPESPSTGPTALLSPAKTPAPSSTEASATTAESVVADARKRLDTMKSYQVEINRQERIGDRLLEPEDVVLSIRREPRAVRLEWRQGPHRGREVIYSDKETNGMMQVNMADSAIPLPRLSLPPDSPLILRTSRHPITEAGFGTILDDINRTIAANQAGDRSRGDLSYAGMERPDPLDRPCHKLVRVTATGETWQVFLDPESKLPAMVQANAPNGDLLERYLFRNVRVDPADLAKADAFAPNLRWGEPKGLLGRLTGPPEGQTLAAPAAK